MIVTAIQQKYISSSSSTERKASIIIPRATDGPPISLYDFVRNKKRQIIIYQYKQQDNNSYMSLPSAPSIVDINDQPSTLEDLQNKLQSSRIIHSCDDDDLLKIAKEAKLEKDESTSTWKNNPIVAALQYLFASINNNNKNKYKHHDNSRSACQWISIICYYWLFYMIVVLPLVPIGIFYRYLRLDINHPHHSHLILEEPGLNFRPYPVQPGDDGNNKTWGTLVQFNRFDRDRFQQFIYNIDSVVNKYEAHTEVNPLKEKYDMTYTKWCTFESPADASHACMLDARGFGTYCYRNMEYGFPDGQPCFLIRVNKVHGWVPEPYESLQELKDAGFPLDWEEEEFDPRYLPISCTGETDIDGELLGPIDYIFPFERGKKGIPTYFFPYLNQLNYKSPGMMVNFWDVTPSVIIRIKCLLWARNVPHTPGIGAHARLRGGVQFELMVDNGIMQREGLEEESDEWYQSRSKR